MRRDVVEGCEKGGFGGDDGAVAELCGDSGAGEEGGEGWSDAGEGEASDLGGQAVRVAADQLEHGGRRGVPGCAHQQDQDGAAGAVDARQLGLQTGEFVTVGPVRG
ncbi:hypothetical protein ADK60_16030 [Streptomyces sp. XY431]|nr:hypothetical protein ADK60_16030 [Streptomyces sp. XY431]